MNKTLLFLGDSVTASGRNPLNPNDLGWGFVSKIKSRSGQETKIINMGFDGADSSNLLFLMQKEGFNMEPAPDIVTVMIGLNDCRHSIFHDSGRLPIDGFRGNVRSILDFIHTKIVIMEPFIIPQDDVTNNWRQDLISYANVLKEVSNEVGALYIPLDSLFTEAVKKDGPDAYAPDGVHPTGRGHDLIAGAWERAVTANHYCN